MVTKSSDSIREGEDERLLVMIKAMAEVRLAHIKDEKDWQGKIECPVCKGKATATYSAYNSHVSIICETKGCVKVIQ